MEQLAGKRVLIAITKSNWGGAQAYVFALARGWQTAGANVSVALGSGSGMPGTDTGLLAAKLADAGIRVLTLPGIGRDIDPRQEVRALKELVALLKREHPDVLHLNSSKAGVLGALAGRLVHVPRIVFTAHGWPHREPRGFVWRSVAWFGSWVTVLLSHTIIVVSRCDLETAPVLFHKRKVQVVHIGIDSFELEARVASRAFLAPLPQLQKLPRWLIMPAELTRNKGIDTAIHAFAGVAARFRDVALVVVGEGEDHEMLEKLVRSYYMEKRIFLVGFVPDARRYLLAGDFFLMPSRKEGFPYALLEAAHAGLPVIAAKVGGIPEVIQDGENGILIRSEDIDGLADALAKLLASPEEAARMGTALKKTVATSFSEKEMLEKTTEAYVR